MREQALDPKALGRSAVRHWRASPLWLSVCAVVWAGLLVAWVPAMYALAPASGGSLAGADLIKVAWVAGAGLAGTVLWGCLLGFRRAWSVITLSAPASTALLMCCYVLTMLMTPSNGGAGASSDNDNAAGAGLLFLGVPTLLLMSVLLAVGAGAGSLLGTILGRRQTPATP